MEKEAQQNLEKARRNIQDRRYPYVVYRVVDGMVVEYEGAYTRQEADALIAAMERKDGDVKCASKPDA